MPGEPPTTAHSRNAGSSFLKKQTYDTCTQLCGAVDQSSRQSLGLSSCTVFPAPLYHEGNSTQMTSIMKRRLLLFFCCLFGKYIHMIRAIGKRRQAVGKRLEGRSNSSQTIVKQWSNGSKNEPGSMHLRHPGMQSPLVIPVCP